MAEDRSFAGLPPARRLSHLGEGRRAQARPLAARRLGGMVVGGKYRSSLTCQPLRPREQAGGSRVKHVSSWRVFLLGFAINLTAVTADAAPVVSRGETFRCTPTAVYDGDGPIWCAEGPRIRLAGIAAREMDGTCRPNQPCPTASAERSRDALANLVGTPIGRKPQGHVLVRGPTMQCRSLGSGTGSRTAAWCVSPRGGDLSCAMVRGGWALKWARYWRDHTCR